MRVLFTSTRGAGHFLPLVPFAHACERAGHDVVVAGPPDLAEPVESAGLAFWEFDPPPEEELGPIWASVPKLPPDEANRVVVSEIFGRLNTTAALPRVRAACEEWDAELVVREPNEYAGALAAELSGLPHVRVAIGLISVEEGALGIVAGAVDAIRRAEGLAPDPSADALRREPYLSVFPETFDEGSQAEVHRFHDPAWDAEPHELPAWWPGREDEPLVYATFGTVAGQLPPALPVFGVAMEALAELPVRALLTVGRHLDLDVLPPAPDNVRVEPFVPQQDVLAHADAAVVHGGSGSTLGAIAAALPLVVVPLFADQPENARRVAEVGAGIAVEPNREDPAATAPALREAVQAVLSEPSYGERARALAAELRAQPAVDSAVPLLERLGDG